MNELESSRAELERMRGVRAAVADIESFIYDRYPMIDAATRRGHAEILVDSSRVDSDCAEIADNTLACHGYGITKIAPVVRQYALRVVNSYGN